MFKNTYQCGFLSILYAGGSRPLSLWGQAVKNGHIRRVTDEDVQTLALEIMGTNVATTYIICPANKTGTLGVRLPFFIMIVKNMKKYFTFEITIRDDKNMSRRFRVSNYQSTTRVRPFSTSLPIGLTGGWNQIQFNLADFTRRAYGSSYLETLRVQIHANVRIRRIYFSDRLYAEDELPQEFKLYVPISKQKKKITMADKMTGADQARLSIQPEQEPSGAPPTPTEVCVGEEPTLTSATPEPVTESEAETVGYEGGHGEPMAFGEYDLEGEGEEDMVEGEEYLDNPITEEPGTEASRSEPEGDGQIAPEESPPVPSEVEDEAAQPPAE